MIYGSGRSIGVDFEYLTGGWYRCNHPLPMLCTGKNIQTNWLIFNDSSKMLTKISPKMQNLGQSGPYYS